MDLSERLRRLREEAGLTREQLADLSGVTASSIAAYETRGVDPSFTKARRIVRALGCSLDDLVNEGSTL